MRLHALQWCCYLSLLLSQGGALVTEQPGAPHLSAAPLELDARENISANISTQFYTFVWPSHKLGFCRIPKVASMQFLKLFRNLNGLRAGASPDPDWAGVRWPKVLDRNDDWKAAAFVRDPLERYLSAFKSKCLPEPWGARKLDRDAGHGLHLAQQCGQKLSWNVTSEEDAIEAFERRVLADASRTGGVLRYDPHWQLQSMLLRKGCGTKNLFLGYLSDDHYHVSTQVQRMLDMVGADDSERMAGWYFPRDSVSGHTGGIDEIPIRRFFRNPEVVRALLRLYNEDYAVLSLPLPKWLGDDWASWAEENRQRSRPVGRQFGLLRPFPPRKNWPDVPHHA